MNVEIGENTASDSRTATLTVAGLSVSVIQEGAPAPTITAAVSPQPNALGWNKATTTTAFTCAATAYPLASCSSQQTLSSETSGTLVTGEAIDTMGNRATVSVLVKIDKTAPRLTLFSPSQGEDFPSSPSSLAVRGNVVDSRSEIQLVLCGTIPAVVADNGYVCAVPVSSGNQTLQVWAEDRAGNSTTKTVTIFIGEMPVTAIAIAPAKATLMAGEVREISVTDQRGRQVLGGDFSVSNSDVAEVFTETGRTHVRALASGQATVSVARIGLAAESELTVLASAAELPVGTTIWGLNTAGTAPRFGEVVRAIPTLPVDEGEPAALFYLEYTQFFSSSSAESTFVRATTLDGRELWRHTVNGPVQQAAADHHGGLVIVLGDRNPHFRYTSDPTIRRLDGFGRVSWEYVAATEVGDLSEVAIDSSGTVFVVEDRKYFGHHDPQDDIRSELVALAWESGTVTGRWVLGSSSTPFTANCCNHILNATAPIVREDGTVVVVAHRFVSSSVGSFVRFEMRNGEVTSQVVAGTENFNGQLFPWILRRLTPDGQGGLLVTADNYAVVWRINTSNALAGQRGMGIGDSDYIVDLALGEDGVVRALVQDWWWSNAYSPAARLLKLNPVTMSILSSTNLPSAPPFGQSKRPRLLKEVLTDGAVTLADFANGYASEVAPGFTAGWNDTEPAFVFDTATTTARTIWAQSRGTAQGTNAEVDRRKGIFVKAQTVEGPARHISIRVVPTNQAYWRDREPAIFSVPVAESNNTLFFGVFSAAPDPEFNVAGFDICWISKLKSEFNRPNDIITPEVRPLERLPIPQSREDNAIGALIYRQRNYRNDLPYYCPVVSEAGHNSNGYARGLIEATAVVLPMFPTLDQWFRPDMHYLGWHNPVPKQAFEPQPEP